MTNGDGKDPIQWAAESGRDLYDVAEWEPRTALDSLAASVYRTMLAGGRAFIILLASLIVLGQFAITGIAMRQDPWIGVYIVLSIVPALLLAAILWRSDVVMREPIDKLAITFLLGFVFAGFAATLNSAFQGLFLGFGALGTVLFFFLVVGPVEEFVKWLAVRIHVYRSDEFDSVIDGAVYGAMAGLGFAAIENTIYITREYLQSAGIGPGETAISFLQATGLSGLVVSGTAAQAIGIGSGILANTTIQTAAFRTFAGPGHVIYSAFAGYYLGLAKFNPENRGPIVVKGLLIAVFIHALYNTLVSSLGLVIAFVPLLATVPPTLAFFAFVIGYDGFFFLALYTKLRRYKRIFGEVGAEAFYDRERSVTIDEQSSRK